MRGLILEGVAGTGKSTLLERLAIPNAVVLKEDVTLGELVAELADPGKTDVQRCQRLYDLVPVVTQHIVAGRFVILERFHLSYLALMPNWALVDDVDKSLAALDVGQVLLDVPDNALAARSFHRPELVAQRWEQELVAWYGSKARAVEAFRASQQQRRDALEKTRLKSRCINTQLRGWDQYLNEIAAFIR